MNMIGGIGSGIEVGYGSGHSERSGTVFTGALEFGYWGARVIETVLIPIPD